MKQQHSPVSEQELHAYVDGSLPQERRLQVEALLAEDPALAARIGDYFSLNAMLHERYDRILDEPLPARLRPRIDRRWWQAVNWPQLASLAATLVLGIGLGLSYRGLRDPGAPNPTASAGAVAGADFRNARYNDGISGFARQAAVAHVVYSPDLKHPVEIGSDHEQELVRWLSNRIGLEVRPPVLANSGFQLIGGRLLPGTEGPIAQFMYNDANGQRITLCISRRDVQTKTTAFHLYEDGPVNVFYWVDGDIGYAISGGIDRNLLLKLAHDVHGQLSQVMGAVSAPAAASAK